MTKQEKRAVEALTRGFTRMETLYKAKCADFKEVDRE